MIIIIVGIYFDFVCYIKLYNFTFLYKETSNRLFYMAYRYKQHFYHHKYFYFRMILSFYHPSIVKNCKNETIFYPTPLPQLNNGHFLVKANFFRLRWKKYFATYMGPFTNYYYTDSFEFMCVHTYVNMSGHVFVRVQLCASVFAYMWFKDLIRFDRRLN